MTDPVVVVGSGMSGAAVAGALLRRGVPTLVVEAGPDTGRRHVAMSSATAAWMEPVADPHFRPVRSVGGPGSGSTHGTRARVGGRSLYWRGIALRIEDYALAHWPDSISASLNDERGNLGSYAHIERELERWSGHSLDAVRNATEERLLAWVRGSGFRAAIPTPRVVRLFGEGRWSAYSPIEVLPTAGALLAEHRVDSLIARDDGVTVTMSGPRGRQRQRASVVVLCGGAIENARLVSRITGKERMFPLVDHHAQGWLRVGEPVATGASDEASLLLAREPDRRINRFLELHRIQGVSVLDAWCMGEQLPSAVGSRIEVPADREGEPSVRFRLTPEDHAVLASQRGALEDLADRLGFGLRLHDDVDDALDYYQALANAMAEPGRAVAYRVPLGAIDHDACTLPLGGAQVDATGALRQLPAVFVAGPSLFPRAGAANPTLTTLALSELLAIRVAERLG